MKIYVETLGCPKNFNDSQVACGILEAAGHEIVEEAQNSDAIMVNTCGFINDAKKESIEKIFGMVDYKKTLIVSGCLSQRYGEELYEEMPEVDIFLGVNDYGNLPDILEKHQKGQREKHLNLYEKELGISNRKLKENEYTATVKIAEGCDNRCTYCVIPSIRGPYRSRPKEEILSEIKTLADKGIKEIILIAQDTSAYGMDIYGGYVLDQLLTEICKIPKIHWVRIMYCYEERITDGLIETMARESKICKYLDMPLQHGSDKILKAMNRKSTKESIRNTIDKLRAAMEDIHIRTTLITGFPGEDEEEFDQLLNMVEEEKFERLGVFAYSPEEGTPAGKMKNQVAEEVKEERKESVLRSQVEISLKKNQEKIGKTLEVIVETIEDDGSFGGRSQYDAPEIDNGVIFTSPREIKIGEIVQVTITDAFDYDIVGIEQNTN